MKPEPKKHKTLSFFAKYARSYWASLLMTMVSMVFLVGIQLLIPWVIKTAIELIESINIDGLRGFIAVAFYERGTDMIFSMAEELREKIIPGISAITGGETDKADIAFSHLAKELLAIGPNSL